MQLGTTFRNLPPVTKNLLIINVIIWLALQLFPATTLTKFEDICALHYFSADTFLPSQIVTYMFVHVDFLHLLFNMFALFMFGMIIERVLGSARYLFYYISCGIGAALIQEGVFALWISNLSDKLLPEQLAYVAERGNELIHQGYNFSHPIMGELNLMINTPVIGASGAIFGVLLAFGYIFPRQPLYIMFIPIPVQARWFVLGYGALELLQGIGNSAGDNVAHFAHLGGMLIGIIILLYWRKKGIIQKYF